MITWWSPRSSSSTVSVYKNNEVLVHYSINTNLHFTNILESIFNVEIIKIAISINSLSIKIKNKNKFDFNFTELQLSLVSCKSKKDYLITKKLEFYQVTVKC